MNGRTRTEAEQWMAGRGFSVVNWHEWHKRFAEGASVSLRLTDISLTISAHLDGVTSSRVLQWADIRASGHTVGDRMRFYIMEEMDAAKRSRLF